ncbi:MAG: hypothetical protein ACR2KE_03195 [Candidatus Nanopelagicales bacterium]
MTPRRWAAVLVLAVIAYLVLAGWRGVALIASGSPTAVLLGIFVLVIPVIGAWVVWREVSFGYAMQAMGHELEREGDLPVDDFARTPSGRIQPADAERFFAAERARVESAPADWRGWYRLGLAYDAARDRKRAREAMRRARSLFESGRS